MSKNPALLTRAAASPGCFYIPGIDSAIPPELSLSSNRAKALARFADQAAKAGVPLPKGVFTSVDEMVREQWNQYLATFAEDAFNGVRGSPQMHVGDAHLLVLIDSPRNLEVFQLEPVVCPLESARAGLGWFVHNVLVEGISHGHQVYDASMVTYFLEGYLYDMDEFTDQSYARAILLHEGMEVPGTVSEERIQQLREEYRFWPSDLLECLGNQPNLLYGWKVLKERTTPLKPAQALHWLARNRLHPLAKVVQAALELQRAFKADKGRAFCWQISDDELEPVGASCFIAWSEPDLLIEAVEHHEEMLLNGGMTQDAYARAILPLEGATDKAFRQLASDTLSYINRWALLAKLLSHFPTWEENHEG